MARSSATVPVSVRSRRPEVSGTAATLHANEPDGGDVTTNRHPAALGVLRLRRADRGLLPYLPARDDGAVGADDLELQATAPAWTGVRLGPLLPGSHTFEVLLGGVRVGIVTARVQAGRS